jgi:MFS family permease
MADSATSGTAKTANGKTARDWGHYGKRPLVILALVGLVDAIDRGILPGTASKLQDHFGWSDTTIGFLSTAFILGTFVAIPAAGYLADRKSRTRVIGGVLASWGLISGMTAAVQNFAQFFVVRSALGASDAINAPASQSLIADYYPPAIRGRAYAVRQVTPILGTALGTGLGALVAGTIGWRWAFLLVGIPGSILALAMWRMREPERGEHDHVHALVELEPSAEAAIADGAASLPISPSTEPEGGTATATKAIRADIRTVLAIPTLRALMIGTGVITGITAGLGAWAPLFYERHAGLSTAKSGGVTGGLILLGALAGAVVGGIVADRIRRRFEGGPMLAAGVAQAIGAGLLFLSFLHVPTWTVRIPLQFVGVMFLVGALPGLAAMTSEVVAAKYRGTAFAVTTWMGALLAAGVPPLIGFIADSFPITVHGKQKGNLALAFAVVTPFILIGSVALLQGRRHVSRDTARARAEAMAGP